MNTRVTGIHTGGAFDLKDYYGKFIQTHRLYILLVCTELGTFFASARPSMIFARYPARERTKSG